jgi:hypothetical protein
MDNGSPKHSSSIEMDNLIHFHDHIFQFSNSRSRVYDSPLKGGPNKFGTIIKLYIKMKKLLSLFLVVPFFLGNVSKAQVGINTSTPNTNTLLHISENNAGAKSYKGVIIPSYTTIERNANFTSLTAADNGLLIYNTTENCYNYYKRPTGSATGQWINMCNNSSSTTGIVASYIGAPIIVKAGSDFPKDATYLVSSVTPTKYKLAKDDYIQLDFGNSPYPGTFQVYMRNISTESVSISYKVGSSNGATLDPTTSGSFTLAPNALSPSLDPYIGTPAKSYGYSTTWNEALSIVFTLTPASGPERKYFAVWTSIGSNEAGSGGSAIRTELYQYVE